MIAGTTDSYTQTLTTNVAHELAAIEPGLWKAEDRIGEWNRSHWIIKQEGNGVRIRVRLLDGERIEFDAWTPDEMRETQQRTNKHVHARITVAASRTPADMAREIFRRLLPSYYEQLLALLDLKVQYDESDTKRRVNIQRIIEASDGQIETLKNRDPFTFYLNREGVYASGQVYDDSVSFERLSTNIDKAVRIAAILAE